MSGTLWLSCPHCTHRFLFARDDRPEHVLWIACCSRCGKTFPVSIEDRGRLSDTPEASNVRHLPAPVKPPELPPYRPSGSSDPLKTPPKPPDAAAPNLSVVPQPVKTPPAIERFTLTDVQRAASLRLLELALGKDWEWPS